MAVPEGTFKTFEQVGIRESLEDVIYNVDPVDTPFLSAVPHGEATNTLEEWQTHSLAAATNNAALEGDDAPQDTANPTVRLNNRTQISTKDARVSGTGRSVNTAGRADDLDYNMIIRGQELRRDMETVLLSNKAKVAGDAATPRELAGLPAWIATNTNHATGGAPSGADPTGDGTDARTDDGTPRAFTFDQLKDVAQQVFQSGGNPSVLMVGPFNRLATSDFATASNIRIQFQRMEDSVLHTSFEVIETGFSSLKIIPNRFQRGRDAFVLQMDMWAVNFLPERNMAVFDLAKTGDSDARQILSEYTLIARNEKASGGVFDLTTS